MTGAGTRARAPRWALAFGVCLTVACLAAASPLGDAIALYNQKHYPEAKASLERLCGQEPTNAPATYYLGMSLMNLGSLDASKEVLSRAVKLAPENASYLADYAGVCLLLADRDSSLVLALEGRDAMTRAIALNPADLDAREGLMEFYARAPWPIGDADKAFEMAAEIAARNPKRGADAYRLIATLFEKAGRPDRAQSARAAAQRLAAPAKP